MGRPSKTNWVRTLLVSSGTSREREEVFSG